MLAVPFIAPTTFAISCGPIPQNCDFGGLLATSEKHP